MSHDPYSHHPELAELITPAEDSFFRDFSTEKLEALLMEKGLPTGWWHTDEHRNAIRKEALMNRRDDDLWVFAYGSLMWDPAIKFAEVRRAHVDGYRRRFIVKDIYGARGTKASPGLMAALDQGGACDGLAFRIEIQAIEEETDILWRREGLTAAYLPRFVAAQIGDATVEALTFVADHSADIIEPNLSKDQQLNYFANGTGFLGSSAEYLEGIASHFERLGIEDGEVFGMLKELHQLSR